MFRALRRRILTPDESETSLDKRGFHYKNDAARYLLENVGRVFLAGYGDAVVLGAGPVGILGAMVLMVNGFKTCVYSRSKAPNPKSELVESIGAKYFSCEIESVDQLAERIGNIDLVYEAVGTAKISYDVLRVLGLNGVYVFTGIPAPRPPVPVDADLIMRNLVLKNQVVVGTVNADREAFEGAIRDLGIFLKRWPTALRSLITGRYKIDQYRDLLLGKVSGIKNVIALA